MIVFLKSYVTVAKTIEVKYRYVLCIGSTKYILKSKVLYIQTEIRPVIIYNQNNNKQTVTYILILVL